MTTGHLGTRQLGGVGFALLGAVLVGLGLEALTPWLLDDLTDDILWVDGGPSVPGLTFLVLGAACIAFQRPLAGWCYRSHPEAAEPEPEPGGLQPPAGSHGVLLRTGLVLVGLLWVAEGGLGLLAGLLAGVWDPPGPKVPVPLWPPLVKAAWGALLVWLAPRLAVWCGGGGR